MSKNTLFLLALVVFMIASLVIFPAPAAAGSGGSCGDTILASRSFAGRNAEVRASRWATAQMQSLKGDCDVLWEFGRVWTRVSILGK